MATYTQYKYSLFFFKSVSIFWDNILVKAIEVLPVCLLPIINSLCPLPIGNKQSITKIPVWRGWFTLPLVIIPGPFFSFNDLNY